MRKINKPQKKPKVLSSSDCSEERKKMIENRLIIYNNSVTKLPDKRKIKSSIYRGEKSKKDSVYSILFTLYHEKCCYCEERRSNLDVEHYRPKNKVTGTAYPGYFWLGYEWDNLILACKECNRDHKKNHFPVTHRIEINHIPKNNRTLKYYNLENLKDFEKPGILNPEEKNFNPLDYFELNIKGVPNGKDPDGRGSKTISKCELFREDVSLRRQGIIDKIRVLIKSHLQYLDEDESNRAQILSNIRNCIREHVILNNPKIEHTLVYKLIARDYKSLIIPPLEAEYHDIVEEAFKLEFP